MLNELVAGVDAIRWKRKTTSDYSSADASQTSKAVYFRNELRFDAAHDGRIALGARHEPSTRTSSTPLAGIAEDRSQSQNAWEAQASYRVQPLVELYAKAGQSYRVANVDDNAFRSSIDILKPQTSHDLELGATLGDAERKLTARLFRHKLRNEIFYDPTLGGGFGANTNLDPTRRQGIEIDAETASCRRLARQRPPAARERRVHRRPERRPRDGAGAEERADGAGFLGAGQRPVGRPGGAVGGQPALRQRLHQQLRGAIPSYVTFDARYAVKLGRWEIAASGLNLADRHYFSNAFGCQSGIYPSDGRQMKLSARYDF
jgi:iron complex outermembrane receptor protein